MTSIIYNRISTQPKNININISNTPYSSLESQQFANIQYANSKGMKIFQILSEVKSAYNSKQTELKKLLSSCKHKNLFVTEVSRISRNCADFEEIANICIQNYHVIYISSSQSCFNLRNITDLYSMKNLVVQAENESRDIGIRIKRTYEMKKSKRDAVGIIDIGYKYNGNGSVEIDEAQIAILRLIYLLSNSGSSIREISQLVNNLRQKCLDEPFEIVEYNPTGYSMSDDRIISDPVLPYPMSDSNIASTLNIYGIFRYENGKQTSYKWNAYQVELWFETSSKCDFVNLQLCSNFSNQATISTNESSKDISMTTGGGGEEGEVTWISIWYNPAIGLPPNIQIPAGMELPRDATTLYIPVSKL